jgi:TPR repeat protein
MAAAATAPLSAQSVGAGIEAWQKADYSAAVAIWRPLADKGDADAAFNLGQAYRYGRGVPLDLASAQGWFERAARKGHVAAEATLGLMLYQNGNQTGGLRWLKLAAREGEARAMLVYGTALYNGDGIPRDPLLGYAYVNGAAEQNLAQARSALAQLDQILTDADREKALAIDLAKADATLPPKPDEEPAAAKPAKSAKLPKPRPPAILAPGPAPAATGAWRIQIGAFSKKGSAEALFRKLSGKGALAGRKPFYIPAGAMTRLQVGPFATRTSAQAACDAVKPQPCFTLAVGSIN